MATIAAAATATPPDYRHHAATTTHRISLAALYLGTEDHEQRLVAVLDETLQARPNVSVQLLFDGRRAHRVSRVTSLSTVSLLEPILAKYPGEGREDRTTPPLHQPTTPPPHRSTNR